MSEKEVATLQTDCPICDGKEHDVLYERRAYVTGDLTHFGIVRCLECGHIYLNPRPTDETIGDWYDDDYYTVANAGATESTRITEHAKKYVEYVRRHVGRTDIKLLDVGCGDGEFLEAMAACGAQCYGVEPDERTREAVAKKIGIVSACESVDCVRTDGFDCITMFESIEHIPRPMDTLHTCFRLLAPGGFLLVKTPNGDSFERKVLGPDWVSLEIPRHLQFFNSKSLKYALDNSGFGKLRLYYPSQETALLRSVFLKITGKGRNIATGGSGGEFTAKSWRRTVDRALARLMLPFFWALSLFGAGHTVFAVGRKPREEQDA